MPTFGTRRGVLLRFMTLATLVPAIKIAGLDAKAKAAGTTAKAAVRYQDMPKGTAMCGNCASFIPGSDPSGPGTCRIVEGQIPQTGWCILYSAR